MTTKTGVNWPSKKYFQICAAALIGWVEVREFTKLVGLNPTCPQSRVHIDENIAVIRLICHILQIHRFSKSASIMDTNLIIFLSAVLIVAATFDLLVHKIPNLITYPTMASAIIYYFIIMGLDGVLFSIKGLAVGTILFIIPYSMGVMGAGDAKLMGAVGSILGAEGVIVASICIAIVGGLYAVTLLLMHPRYLKEFLQRHFVSLKTFIFTGQYITIPAAEPDRQPKLYYGAAIALGTFVYFF